MPTAVKHRMEFNVEVPDGKSPRGLPRVLFLNRSYWPDAEATGQLLTELCEDLSGQFEITVVAGQPNQNPRNETFAGNHAEKHNGVTIERVLHPRWSKRSLFGRAMNLIGFLVTASVRSFRLSRPDVIVVETDPFMLPLLGSWLKWWHGSRFVVYLQDLYPDVAVVLDKVREGWLTKFLRDRLTQAYRRADVIIVLSSDMKNRLIRWGLDAAKIACVENWVDTNLVFPVKEDNALRKRLNLHHHFVVMHSGNMGLSQYLNYVLDAASLIQEHNHISILMVGDGATRISLEEQATRLQLKNIRFLPYQPRDELAISLSAADVHLISMHPEVHHCLMPSKLYGILASGTAVIAITAEDSELAQIIKDYRIGLAVPPANPETLAKAIHWCAAHPDELRQMGQRARALAVAQYDRKGQTEKFAEFLIPPSNDVREVRNSHIAASEQVTSA
jgi:colanic acid biosynthesis glycosyl transferase WcaI